MTGRIPIVLKLVLGGLLISVLVSTGVAFGAGGGGSGGGGGWGTGGFVPGGVGAGVGVNPTATSVPESPDPPPSSVPPFYYVEVPCTECALDGEVCLANGKLGLIPIPPGPDPVDNLPPGDTIPVYVEIVDSATDKVVGDVGETLCNPPPTPPPPSAELVWDTAPLPTPQIEFNPGTFGVTQLATWFWLNNDAEGVDLQVAVPGGVGGYAVTLAVHPVAYYWTFGDGASAVSYTAGGPGSAADASTTHTYTEPGTYSVGLTVAWAGSYTFTGYGVTETVDLGPVDQAETNQNYVVQEIRSILEPPGSD